MSIVGLLRDVGIKYHLPINVASVSLRYDHSVILCVVIVLAISIHIN